MFPNTDIKGGVAVSYHDDENEFGAIGTFTSYQELNTILHKVVSADGFVGLNTIGVTSYAYHFTEKMHEDNPEAVNQLSKGHANDLKSSVFERLTGVFLDEKPADDFNYIRILGRMGNERVYKFIREDYINEVVNLHKYKIFLPMAYGDGHLTLANFDDYTEDDVFLEVTGITEDDFRFLRDGGDYENPETGETEHFEGHLFDEVVFNDSIEEFWKKKQELADYFDESKDEDIFDYIPPQKTNQIFTPRWVVEKMVDQLEENNPG